MQMSGSDCGIECGRHCDIEIGTYFVFARH